MSTVASACDQERAARWSEVFGKNEVPIKSIIPSYAYLPGSSEPQLIYMLDLQAITPEQLSRIAQQIAEKFGLDLAVVEEGIPVQGVPILAEQVLVSTDDFGQIASLMDGEFDDLI